MERAFFFIGKAFGLADHAAYAFAVERNGGREIEDGVDQLAELWRTEVRNKFGDHEQRLIDAYERYGREVADIIKAKGEPDEGETGTD